MMDAPARSTSSLPSCQKSRRGSLTVLLRSLALALVLGGQLEQLALCSLKTNALVVALIVSLADALGVAAKSAKTLAISTIDPPSKPDVGGSTSNRSGNLLDTGLARGLLRYASDDDRSRSISVDVSRVRQPALTNLVKVLVLSVNQVERPSDEDDGDDKVSNMADLVVCGYVAESKLVETCVACVGRNGATLLVEQGGFTHDTGIKMAQVRTM
jgi:hypothetical protein